MSRWSSFVGRALAGALPLAVGAALALAGADQLEMQNQIAARVALFRGRLDLGRGAERALLGLDATWRTALTRPDDDARHVYEWMQLRVRKDLTELRRGCESAEVEKSLAEADELLARWHASVVEPSFEAAEQRRQAGSARDDLDSLAASERSALLRERTRAQIGVLQAAFRFNDRAHAATLALDRDLEARESTQRAFLLAGSGEELGRLEAAEALLREHVAALRSIAPQEQAAIDALEGLIERWSQEVAGPQIEARRALPSASSTASLEFALAESPLLQSARTALREALDAELAASRSLETKLWEGSAWVQRWTLAALLGVAVLGAIVAWSMGRRARVAPAPAGMRAAIARIDRSLEQLAQRQADLQLAARELTALPLVPVRAAPLERIADARAQLEDLLVWLARREQTLFLALYTTKGREGPFACELAVGWNGQRLAAADFSPGAVHDAELAAEGRIFVEGPFELSGELLGGGPSPAIAHCVIGSPILVAGQRVGVLLSAHRELPKPESEEILRVALEWIARWWPSESRPAAAGSVQVAQASEPGSQIG